MKCSYIKWGHELQVYFLSLLCFISVTLLSLPMSHSMLFLSINAKTNAMLLCTNHVCFWLFWIQFVVFLHFIMCHTHTHTRARTCAHTYTYLCSEAQLRNYQSETQGILQIEWKEPKSVLHIRQSRAQMLLHPMWIIVEGSKREMGWEMWLHRLLCC